MKIAQVVRIDWDNMENRWPNAVTESRAAAFAGEGAEDAAKRWIETTRPAETYKGWGAAVFGGSKEYPQFRVDVFEAEVAP